MERPTNAFTRVSPDYYTEFARLLKAGIDPKPYVESVPSKHWPGMYNALMQDDSIDGAIGKAIRSIPGFADWFSRWRDDVASDKTVWRKLTDAVGCKRTIP